jgi:hypothetical protein
MKLKKGDRVRFNRSSPNARTIRAWHRPIRVYVVLGFKRQRGKTFVKVTPTMYVTPDLLERVERRTLSQRDAALALLEAAWSDAK